MIVIDIHNVADFPKGTKLEFNFGAYYPTVEGVVTGYEVAAATKWFDASVSLTAEYEDLDTGEIVKTTVTRIQENGDKGIGTRVIEVGEAQETKSKSKWSQ